MNREQALNDFWNSFGLTAYDESTVPDDATLPYITYGVSVDDFDHPVSVTASIWDRGTSWSLITQKLNVIAERIGIGGVNIPHDTGVMWLKKGSPFAQRVADEDRTIRRIYMNIEIEFIN